MFDLYAGIAICNFLHTKTKTEGKDDLVGDKGTNKDCRFSVLKVLWAHANLVSSRCWVRFPLGTLMLL